MNEMSLVFQAFKELQSTTKKTEKIEILDRYKDNELFKKTLVWLLSPFVTTGISTKKLSKTITPYQEALKCEASWEDVMEYIDQNNTGKDKDISFIQWFLSDKSQEENDFYEKLITKTLKLGVNARTVNAVYGKSFVPLFEVQLGKPLKECKIAPERYFYISRKLNGNRGVFYDGEFRSRTGQIYQGLEHIKEALANIGFDYKTTVLDGEILYKNHEGLTDSAAFQKGDGILNSKALNKPEMFYKIFDILPKSEFDSGQSSELYSERKARLVELSKILSGNDNVQVVEFLYEGTDLAQIPYWLEKCESELDYEGIMIQFNEPYMCKRTKELIKAKIFYDCDIRCIGMINGGANTKYEHTLGSVVCNYKGYEICANLKMPDEMRDYYWTHPDEIVGKIVTVQYKEETRNKRGELSLQFPRVICVRKDKNEESYN